MIGIIIGAVGCLLMFSLAIAVWLKRPLHTNKRNAIKKDAKTKANI